MATGRLCLIGAISLVHVRFGERMPSVRPSSAEKITNSCGRTRTKIDSRIEHFAAISMQTLQNSAAGAVISS